MSASKNNIKFTIRRTDDLSIIHRLDVKIFGSHDLSDLTSDIWMVIRADSEPVGFAGLLQEDEDSDEICLSKCGVLKKYRGFGIQRMMIRARERWVKKETNCKTITTYTAGWNVYSANNLIKEGYLISEFKSEDNGWLCWSKRI